MTTGRTDDKLDGLLRAYYHTEIDGLSTPDTLVDAVRAATRPAGKQHRALVPLLALTLAGASFVIVLASSRAVEILLNL